MATLLAIAQRRSEELYTGSSAEMMAAEKGQRRGDVDGNGGGGDDDKDLDDYELWREMKKTVKALRDDMGKKPDKSGSPPKHKLEQDFETLMAMEKAAQALRMQSAVGGIGQERASYPNVSSKAENPGNDSSIHLHCTGQDRPLTPPPCVKGYHGHTEMQTSHDVPSQPQHQEMKVRGKKMELDYHNVPIIADGIGFVYSD